MPALALEPEFRTDQQITADFLVYVQSEFSDCVAYEVEPTRLKGGNDARLYRYKLIDQEQGFFAFCVQRVRWRSFCIIRLCIRS